MLPGVKTDPRRPSDRRVQTVCLLTLTLLAAGGALFLLRPVLVPFVLALFFTQCLAPVIKLLMRHANCPRGVAVTVAALLGVGVLTGAGFVVASSVGKMEANSDAYADSLKNLTNKVIASNVARRAGVRPGTVDGAWVRDAVKSSALVGSVFSGTASVLSSTGTTVLLMIFMLYGRRNPPRRPGGLMSEIDDHVQRYISLTVVISVLTGGVVWITLGVLGVQFAAVFGLLAFLLNFIPNVGAVLATLLPLPIVLLDPHLHVPAKVMAFAIPGGFQVFVGSLVQPRLLGNSLDLHPVVVVLSLLFFAYIWGVAGAFLAVPLTAVFRIVFERIPSTRPLAAALAGNLGPLTDTFDSPAVEVVTAVPVVTAVAPRPANGTATSHGDAAARRPDESGAVPIADR